MKTKHFKFISLLLLISILFTIIPTNVSAATKLNKNSKSLNIGSSFRLKLKGQNKISSYSVDNERILQIKQLSKNTFFITALASGKATITIETNNKKILKCNITVKEPEIKTTIIEANNKHYVQFTSTSDNILDINCSIILKDSQNNTVWRTSNLDMILSPNGMQVFEMANYNENLSLIIDYKNIKKLNHSKELELFSQLEFSGIVTQNTPSGTPIKCVMVKNNSNCDINFLECSVLFYSEEEEFLAMTTGTARSLYAGTETDIHISNSKELFELYPNSKLYFHYEWLRLY